MIEPRPIGTAPKDGTPIFAYDGEWWRDKVRWKAANHFGPPGWYFMGFRLIQPTHWHPDDLVCPELQALVDDGYLPASSVMALHKRRSRRAVVSQ